MPEDYFKGRAADRYDDDAASMFDPETLDPAVSFLAELSGPSGALEFGIGTGRVALPLSGRGVAVAGIDLSVDMVEKLASKPGAGRIDVTVGDYARTRLARSFSLVYLVFNTITNLTSQEDQVDAFCNAAAHLEPGGCFVIECYIPELRRLPPGETIHPFEVTASHLGFEEYDTATQIAISHHLWIREGDVEASSTPFRYVWPSELDLMARIAGMTLKERWGSWRRDAFTSESRSQVSVWQTPA